MELSDRLMGVICKIFRNFLLSRLILDKLQMVEKLAVQLHANQKNLKIFRKSNRDKIIYFTTDA